MQTAYREEVRALTSWCQDNNLQLNVSKTKELIVDFRRRQREEHAPLSINGTTVERVKRGSDELNMYGSSPNSMTANGSDSKKQRLDESPPSRVLHIRKLPNEVSETEVIALGLPFGKVTNILMLKGKNQVNFNKSLYSTISQYFGVNKTSLVMTFKLDWLSLKQEKDSDTLSWMWFVIVLKLNFNVRFQAFLELGTEEAAITMVNYYTAVTPQVRNTPVFIQYSNHKELKTDSALNQRAQAVLQAVSAVQDGSSPSSDPGVLDLAPPPSPVLRIIIDNMFYPVTLDVLQQIFSKFGTVMKIITFTKNNQFQALLQFSDPVNAQQAKLSLDGQNIYNSCCTLRIDFSKLVNLNVKYNNDKSRDYTRPDLPTGDGESANKDHSLLGAISPLSAAAAAAAAAGRVALSGSGVSGVLLASNLNEEILQIDFCSPWTVTGVYGDVQRVKILYNKKDSALIQLSDGNQAQLAMSHLNGQKVFGKVMRVTLSKHQTVALPREGLDDQLLTKGTVRCP
ncbi:hypothetical protein L3Q82_006297 [Scortum barcoo]|uniref:Uncharacterized protein n=1 Tax=Scortum barcoo TaxID=214431 RepID=A0ACB8X302_9TELE|nr:hypothetical protein L3Q82_006297 [Scortum barcoo]